MANQQTVKVPDLGGASEVEVIELCVTNGDTVSEGQSLIVVESDKASMDVPSPLAGRILSIEVSEGSTVSEGDAILQLEVSGDAADAVDANETAEKNAQGQENADAASGEGEQSVQVNGQAPETDTAAAAVSAGSTSQPVLVPDLGGADAVELIEILVKPGDEVAEGDGLLVMESDKASMELPSPVSGTIESIDVEIGASLAEGQQVATILAAGGAAPSAPQKTAAAAKAPEASAAKDSEPAPQADATPPAQQAAASSAANQNAAGEAPRPKHPGRTASAYAGPAVRKLARELGVNLADVQGSGPRARINKDDLHSFVKQRVNAFSAAPAAGTGGSGIPAVPEIDFSQFGEVEIEKMSRLHKLTAANMQRSWLNVPHVTQFDDADITELEAFRKSLKPQMEKRGVKISPLPFIVKAVALALRDIPAFNASLGSDGETIVRKKYVHIGMAVDTPAGLMVPVIRNADKKGIWELAEEISELAGKARERKLQPAEMQGGCFTISSLGGIGGQGFTPIVNTPEVGILGVSRAETKPVFIDGNFQPRTMLPLSLSYDHRVVNGGDAGRFLTRITALLADLRQALL
ncbi:MAG: dihydrolipoyllysine-residue acetyltransferase [Pseudomonadales bacterium]